MNTTRVCATRLHAGVQTTMPLGGNIPSTPSVVTTNEESLVGGAESMKPFLNEGRRLALTFLLVGIVLLVL